MLSASLTWSLRPHVARGGPLLSGAAMLMHYCHAHIIRRAHRAHFERHRALVRDVQTETECQHKNLRIWLCS
jgi:hypothetical protein